MKRIILACQIRGQVSVCRALPNNVKHKVDAIIFMNSVNIWMDGCVGGSWLHLMSCSWSFISFDLLIYMVQFLQLLGSEIIFQIINWFGLARLQNGGGHFKINI